MRHEHDTPAGVTERARGDTGSPDRRGRCHDQRKEKRPPVTGAAIRNHRPTRRADCMSQQPSLGAARV